MKSIASILLLLALHGFAFGQTVKLDWANQMQGSSFDVCQAITLDDAGNVYATGFFSATVDFDAGPGVYNLKAAAAEDIFISKTSAEGKLVWAKSIGDFRYQAGYAITLDAAKNIYITGIFFGTVDFDPGPGITNLASAGNEDIFICKLDNNGNFNWAKRIGGISNDYCNAIVLDKANNIYLNGYFDNTADFDPGNGVFNLTSRGQTDIYVCKLTNGGNFIWAKQIGGTGSEAAYSIGLDDQDNVYSAGFFFGATDFDPGPAITSFAATGFGDGYILKLTTAGDYVKAITIGGNEKVRCTNLKIDKSGAIYITGYFDGNADYDPGSGNAILSSAAGDDDIFIAKYTLNQELVWAKQIAGPSFQKAFFMDVDAAGNIYTTGHFNGSVDFDPGTASFNLAAFGDPSIFVLKLSSAGNFIWAAQCGGLFFSTGYCIKTDQQNNIHIGGTFEGTVDFDPGMENYQLTSAGESEIFIQKLRQCTNAAIVNTLNINTCSSYVLNNKVYDSSGSFTQSVLNAAGCDSILIYLNLTINRIIKTLPVNICDGEKYFAGGKLQTVSGIYYDTVKTSSGCDSVTITQLLVQPSPKPTLGAARNICQGQNLTLNPGNFSSYVWQDLSTQQNFTASIPGLYKVRVTNQFNCSAVASVALNKIVPQPQNFLTTGKQLCTGDVLKLNVPGYKNYLWSTGEVSEQIEIRKPGVYFLNVISADDCTGSDTVTIIEINCMPVNVPNAFTPNKDGKNDIFKPAINREITAYQLKIFNRLGQQVFASFNYEEGWNGEFKQQPQQGGSYVYQIIFKNVSGQSFVFSGTVLLLR